MVDPLALGAAFAVVFLAELGDRTQLVLLALAARRPRLPLLAGAGAAFLVQALLAVLVGERLASWLPRRAVLVLGGGVFLILGGWGLLATRRAGSAPERLDESGRGAFLAAFLLVLLAELGDKTQIATAALAAATREPLAVFLGAFLALMAGAALAVVVGRALARRLRARTARLGAALLFVVAGALMLVLAATLPGPVLP